MDDFSLLNALKLLRALGDPEEEENGIALEAPDFSAYLASDEEITETETDPLGSTARRKINTSSHISGIDLQNEEFNDVGEGKSPRWSKNMRLYPSSMGTEGDSKEDTVVSSNLRDIPSPKSLFLSGTETFSREFSVSHSSYTTAETEDTKLSREYSFSAPFACPPSTSSKTIMRSDSAANPSPHSLKSAVRIVSKPSLDFPIDAEHPGFNLQKTLRLLRSLDEDDTISFKETSTATRGDYDLDVCKERDEINEKSQSEAESGLGLGVGVGVGEDYLSTQRLLLKKTREGQGQGLSYNREAAVREEDILVVHERKEGDKIIEGKVELDKENTKDDQSDSPKIQPETLNPQASLSAFNQHVIELMTAIGEPEEEDKRDRERQVELESSADGKYAIFRSEFREYEQNSADGSCVNYTNEDNEKIDYDSDEIGVKRGKGTGDKMGVGGAKAKATFGDDVSEGGGSGGGRRRSSPFNDRMQGSNNRHNVMYDNHSHSHTGQHSLTPYESNVKTRVNRNGSTSSSTSKSNSRSNSNSSSNSNISNSNFSASSSGSIPHTHDHSNTHIHSHTHSHASAPAPAPAHTKSYSAPTDYSNSNSFSSQGTLDSVFMSNVCSSNFNNNNCYLSSSGTESIATSTSTSAKITKNPTRIGSDATSQRDLSFVRNASFATQNARTGTASTASGTAVSSTVPPAVAVCVRTERERVRDEENESKK
jgi:trimeric autotransporter adhesin